jgi:hypothetical protein
VSLTKKLIVIGVAVSLSLVLFLLTPAFVQRAERVKAQDQAKHPICPCVPAK